MSSSKLNLGGIVTLMAPIVLIFFLSTSPGYTYHQPDESMIIVSFKKTTERRTLCDDSQMEDFRSTEDTQRSHMRKKGRNCGSRDRVSLEMIINMDGDERFNGLIQPSGLNSDGVVFIYERFSIKAGDHTIEVKVRDNKDPNAEFKTFKESISLKGHEIAVIDYDKGKDSFFLITGDSTFRTMAK